MDLFRKLQYNIFHQRVLTVKFYISSLFSEKERVRELYKRLEGDGHEITVDWTQHKGVRLDEREEKRDMVQEYAVKDVDGVRDCDVFVILTEPLGGRTQYGELGVAIMSFLIYGKPLIYAVGEKTNQVTFYYHPSVRRRKSFDEVLTEIEKVNSIQS